MRVLLRKRLDEIRFRHRRRKWGAALSAAMLGLQNANSCPAVDCLLGFGARFASLRQGTKPSADPFISDPSGCAKLPRFGSVVVGSHIAGPSHRLENGE
jgi:hypothetical protein